MRVLIVTLAIAAAASPALAQAYGPLIAARDADLTAQADAARRRDVELTNQVSVIDARLRTDQALRDVQAQQQRPIMPTPIASTAGKATPPTPVYAQIPDDRLAASNARARAAAGNRR